jgi:tRNA nucleotidyltransferase/poly(A) polymerase
MKKFLVGGAVRDKLLGLTPKDNDWVVVHATPMDVSDLLRAGFEQVGADFPVFLHPVTKEEYALARMERKTSPGYRGFTVTADANVTIEEDLARRDLTINSMAMDDDGNLIDPYNGQKDLASKILRHTTEAFAEDPLRVLRLARFAARFTDFEMAEATINLCHEIGKTGELDTLSNERIWLELEKGLSEDPFVFVYGLEKLKVLKNCTMFKELFNLNFNDLLSDNCNFIHELEFVPVQDRLMFFCTIFGDEAALKNYGATARIQECKKNFLAYKNLKGNSAVQLLDFLKQIGTFKQGTSFDDTIRSIRFNEEVGHLSHSSMLDPSNYRAAHLVYAGTLVQSIKASHFQIAQGKELGEAIEMARVAILRKKVT